MKIEMYYATEIRMEEFDNKIVSLFFEKGNTANRLVRQEYLDIRNNYLTVTGALLDKLLPVTDNIGTLRKVCIYEGDVMIKEINNVANPAYRIYNPTKRETGVDLANPVMIETFLMDIK